MTKEDFLSGVKIGVTSSFEITHQSVGKPNAEFFETKEKFLKKYNHILPLDLKPQDIYVEKIKRKPIKNIGKVAIITPTKGKVEMLYDCVKSFYDNCDSRYFDYFIADTGSTENEKNWIKKNILPLGNIKLIEYDYYHFAKINNDVVKNYISDEYEFLLFCNNDIKILNDVIYGMLKVFKENKNTGTVGCRLHYKDNTVQHGGISAAVNQNKEFYVSHLNIGNYYNYSLSETVTIGNTGGLMMIRKKIFIKLNMFNENYIECFEDVELNFKCIINGLKNITCGNLVSYHYESLSRDENPDKIDRLSTDYTKMLLPFVNLNLSKLKEKLLFIK
jgi:GT2 family glycosyltransferase